MDDLQSLARQRRQVFLLFGLLAVFALLATALGGLYLMTGQVQPDAVKPLAETGEILLCYGRLNLLVLFGLFWQIRRLTNVQR